MTALESIQNENGGGLSVSITGKYTSVRHAIAKENGKLTAGDAAKMLSKLIKTKVSAKEIVKAYTLIIGREPEWHHAGFYKGAHGSKMGRTFFFEDFLVETLASRWSEAAVKQAEFDVAVKVKTETIIKGFYYEWDHDYNGKYGKKRNFKVLKSYNGSELSQPRNFTSCNDVQFSNVLKSENKKYFGWDEPTISEF